MWAKTDKTAAAPAKQTADKTAPKRLTHASWLILPQSQLVRKAKKIFLQLLICGNLALHPSHNYNIKAAAHLGLMEPINLLQPPPHLIAHHRFPDFGPNGKPQTAPTTETAPTIDDNQACGRTLPCVVHSAKFVILFDGACNFHVLHLKNLNTYTFRAVTCPALNDCSDIF